MAPSTWIYISCGVIVAIAIGVYISHLAGRLDRAHLKVESTRSALHTNLALRSSLALEVAGLGNTETASAVALRSAARLARDEEVADAGWHQESVLSAAIVSAVGGELTLAAFGPASRTTLDDLASVCRRVQYSRRFHNDAVRQARDLRARFLPRVLRLAGRAALPDYVDFDDSVPATLEAR
jgi:hypothetical protein